MKISEKYYSVCLLYKRFALGSESLDFSQDALEQMYESETYGKKHDLSKNGYYFGKKSLNITIASWKEDLADGLFCKHELLDDFTGFDKLFLEDMIKDLTVNPLFGYNKKEYDGCHNS